MDAIQWARVIRKAEEDVELLLADNEDGMLDAFTNNKRRLSASVAIEITSLDDFSAAVKTSISYVIQRVKEGAKNRVTLNQEPLPGMSEATRSGRGKKKAVAP